MSDYSKERYNIIKRMNDLSQKIFYSTEDINVCKTNIKECEVTIIKKQQYIDECEIELIYLMDELKQEFQE